jgi:hypothetical protein
MVIVANCLLFFRLQVLLITVGYSLSVELSELCVVRFHSGFRVSFPEVRRPGPGDDKVVPSLHIERNSLNINQSESCIENET